MTETSPIETDGTGGGGGGGGRRSTGRSRHRRRYELRTVPRRVVSLHRDRHALATRELFNRESRRRYHAAGLSRAGRPPSARSRRHRRCRSRGPTQPRPTTAWTPSRAGCSALTAARYRRWGRGPAGATAGSTREEEEAGGKRDHDESCGRIPLGGTNPERQHARSFRRGLLAAGRPWATVPPTKSRDPNRVSPPKGQFLPEGVGPRLERPSPARRFLGSSSQRGRGEQAIDARLHERHSPAVDLGSEEPQRCRVHEQTERDRQHHTARDDRSRGRRARAWRPDRPSPSAVPPSRRPTAGQPPCAVSTPA